MTPPRHHRGRAAAALLLLLAGCATAEPPPPRRPAAPSRSAATAPRAAEAPWLSRFWSELSSPQRSQVRGALRRVDPALARNDREAARFWDGLGARERMNLVSGSGRVSGPALPPPPALPEDATGN